MATLELGALVEHLEDSEIAEIRAALTRAEVEITNGEIDDEGDDEPAHSERGLDDDLFADFQDHLDANEVSCDIYLPSEFDITFKAAGYTIGSAHALLAVLEELKDDLFSSVDEDEDEDYDEDEDEHTGPLGLADEDDGVRLGLKEESMRHLWKLVHESALGAIDRGLALFIRE